MSRDWDSKHFYACQKHTSWSGKFLSTSASSLAAWMLSSLIPLPGLRVCLLISVQSSLELFSILPLTGSTEYFQEDLKFLCQLFYRFEVFFWESTCPKSAFVMQCSPLILNVRIIKQLPLILAFPLYPITCFIGLHLNDSSLVWTLLCQFSCLHISIIASKLYIKHSRLYYFLKIINLFLIGG